MAKPPMPGMGRIVLRLLVLLALALALAAPDLAALADHIPGQSGPTRLSNSGNRIPGVPPQRMLANALRALNQPPILWVTLGTVAGGVAVMVLELAWAAGTIVRRRWQWRSFQAVYLRVRPLRPQSRKGAQRDVTPADLWRNLHALDLHLREQPGSWCALTLTAQPEEPATVGAVTIMPHASSRGSRSGPPSERPALARALESMLLGQDSQLVVDTPPDPLAQLPAGAVILWQDLTLARPPHLPIRTSDEAESIGALAAALRTPADLLVAEIQLAWTPRRDMRAETAWRVRARRRLVDLQRRAAFGVSEESRRLEAKLASEAFDVTVRLVAVASDRAAETRAHAILRELRAAFGQYQQRAGLGIQRWTMAPFGSGRHVVAGALVRTSLHAIIAELIGLAAVSSALAAGVYRLDWPGLLAGLVPLALWVGLRGARVLRQSAAVPPLLRAPRIAYPARLLLPLPLWRGPSILSSDEAAGLWHLPSVRLQSLIAWLPNRYLPAQPSVFVPHNASERLILGSARTRDGRLAPVGPSLRDLRQVLHITAGMGAGKSRALANIAAQVIQQLRPSGLVLLDGKGDDPGCLAATVRLYVPQRDEARLMLVDLLDAEWPIGLNPFYGIDLKKAGGPTQALGIVLAVLSRLDPELMQKSMGMIQYIQMATILIVEGEPAPTFASLKQCLEDEAYRRKLLPTCTNLEVINFWTVTYPQTSDQQRNSLHALLRRFDNLLVDETTRYLLTQPVPTIDLLDAIETGAIVLAPMPHRTLGGMAEFIGMLLLQAVMRAAFQRPGTDQSRATVPLMIDELQVFVGAGDSQDIRDALTQLRGFGIAGIYAHQTLAQLGNLRDEMLTNSASRLILRTQEPDASVYARQYPTTDLTPADISGQHPNEHQYAVLASSEAPAEVFSLQPRLWPEPIDVDSGLAAYRGPDWQTVLPTEADPLDRLLLRLVYGPIEVARVAAQLALMPGDEWDLLLTRWHAIRACQRAFILERPGCIPDRLERQRWLSRLWIATPRVLAAAVYQRQRWAIDPAEQPAPMRPRPAAVRLARDESAPVSTALVAGIAPESVPEPPAMQAGRTVAEALRERGRRRVADAGLEHDYGDIAE